MKVNNFDKNYNHLSLLQNNEFKIQLIPTLKPQGSKQKEEIFLFSVINKFELDKPLKLSFFFMIWNKKTIFSVFNFDKHFLKLK